MPTFAKLDRFLIPETWDGTLPLSTYKAFPNTLSDHIPISFHTSSTYHYANRFHFESMWLERQDLRDIMAGA